MRDDELVADLVSATRTALRLVIAQAPSIDGPQLDVCDIELSRHLARIMIAGGADRQALRWTSEVLELTAAVMIHHRSRLPAEVRAAWSEVGLLYRTAGLAFAEAIGRVPGSERRLGRSVLDVTQAACAELGRHADHPSVRDLLHALDTVESGLEHLAGSSPYPGDAVVRVGAGLRLGDDAIREP